MSRGSALFTLVISIVAGLFASFTVMKYVKTVQAQNIKPEIVRVPVVIAKQVIPAGTRIRPEHLTVKEFDKTLLPAGVHSDIKEIDGRVTRSTVYAGEAVVEARLADSGSPEGLTALVPPGYRAITLKVDDTIGVGGFIRPGHFVDVVTTIDLDGGRMELTGKRELISKVILQNVQVVATGKELETSEDEEKDAKIVPTVTVLVTLEQAERVALATGAGHIRLVLRNHSDHSEEITSGVTLASLIPLIHEEYEPLPEPEEIVFEPPVEEFEPVKEEFYVVEVFRGSEKSEVTFKK